MVDQKRKNRITRITRVGTMLGVASILALASMSNAMARTAQSGWYQYVNYKGADQKGQATKAAIANALQSLNSTCDPKGGVKSKTQKPHQYKTVKKNVNGKIVEVETAVKAKYTFECNNNR